MSHYVSSYLLRSDRFSSFINCPKSIGILNGATFSHPSTPLRVLLRSSSLSGVEGRGEHVNTFRLILPFALVRSCLHIFVALITGYFFLLHELVPTINHCFSVIVFWWRMRNTLVALDTCHPPVNT